VDKESDAELEEINKLTEPCVQSCLSSEDKYQGNHTYFQLEVVMCQMSLILLDLQMAINQLINQSTKQMSPTYVQIPFFRIIFSDYTR